MTSRSSPARAPCELLLEARDQPVGAELDHVAAGLAALERLAVDRPTKSITTKSPSCGLALDGLERGERLAQALELGLDLLRSASGSRRPTSTPL